MLSVIIAAISGPYLSVIAVGRTASPGESIAGTTSPAPFGPGTLNTPSAYFLGGSPVTAPAGPGAVLNSPGETAAKVLA